MALTKGVKKKPHRLCPLIYGGTGGAEVLYPGSRTDIVDGYVLIPTGIPGTGIGAINCSAWGLQDR